MDAGPDLLGIVCLLKKAVFDESKATQFSHLTLRT
jgi:hypothetical protein